MLVMAVNLIRALMLRRPHIYTFVSLLAILDSVVLLYLVLPAIQKLKLLPRIKSHHCKFASNFLKTPLHFIFLLETRCSSLFRKQ